MALNHYRIAVDLQMPFDSGIQRSILLEAAFRADYRGVLRMPQSELAQVTLFSPRIVAKEFGRLQELGLLEREGHGRYRLRLDAERGAVFADLVEEELANLRSQLRPGQVISANDRGWPILIDRPREQ